MNIIHVVIDLSPGGLERLVVEWTRRQNRQDLVSARVCCLDGRGELADELLEGQVVTLDAQRSTFPWDWRAISKLRELARAGRETVLHCHNLAAWQYGVLASFRTRAKVVYTQHGANPHNWNLIDRLRAKVLAMFTSRLVAVSEATAGVMTGQLGLPEKKTTEISNGVDNEVFKPADFGEKIAARKKLRISDGSYVIGSIGRLAPEKGYDLLIEAFAGVVEAGAVPNPMLVIVGSGPEKRRIEDMIAGRKLGKSVRLVGVQDDVRPWFQAMDLFCLPSKSEGMSVSLLEAGACGLPSVASDAGGNAEVVVDGVTGIVVQPLSVEGLKAALLKVMTGGELGRQMGAKARQRVVSRFSIDSTLKEYTKVYRS